MTSPSERLLSFPSEKDASTARDIESRRAAAIADFLQPGERIVGNTSARLLPDPEDRGVGVLFVTNRRLVWHLPDAAANSIGDVPHFLFSDIAYGDEVLAFKLEALNGPYVMMFHLYPGPISEALVDSLVGLVTKARVSAGKPAPHRTSDPDALL